MSSARTAAPSSTPSGRTLLLGAALVALLALAYWRALSGGFIWDDDLHVTANPTIIGPLGLKEIWTTARANYFPLVLTNFWLLHGAFGLEPLPYHAVTLLCHALAALLLWRVLLRLRVPGAWFGAALWALHPVQVESVAWIAELKNTQSAVFFLAAVLFWLRWVDSPPRASTEQSPTAAAKRSPYALALLCGVAALLSKPSTVMVPVALALAAWWQTRRIDRRVLLALAPFLLLSGLVAGWTIWEQKYHSGAIGPEWSQTWPERCVIAGRALWFYLGKLFWPQPLIFIYPRWEIHGAGGLALAPLGLALIIAATLAWLAARGIGAARALLVGALYFAALLFPVLGFFSVYFFRYSFVGDHFQYLASMAPLALLAAATWRLPRAARLVAATAAVAGCVLLTRFHTRTYRDMESLWTTTVARNPDCRMAWLNLGETLARQLRHGESIAAYQRALVIAPNDAEGHNDLGIELTLIGRADEALPHCERAVQLKPDKPEHHSNLGTALSRLGRHAEAVAAYEHALALDPHYTDARLNLAAELVDAGRPAEAVPHFEAALRERPNHAETHRQFGRALELAGRRDDALREYHRAVALAPDNADAHGVLGRALMQNGEADEALAELRRAAALAPGSGEAHNNLGIAFAQTGRTADAIAEFEAAVRVAPEFAPSRVNLAGAFASAGRWSEAAAQFEAAVRLDPSAADAHLHLAIARVNAGELERALPEFEAALRLDPQLADAHEALAQTFRALGRMREASAHLEAAAELRRRPPRQSDR